MTLTEQWKKGELNCGVYYVQSDDGVVFPSVYSAEYDYIKDISIKDFWYEIVDIKEVLAPVPSYEEWQELKEFADYSLHNRDELTRQINFWMDKHTQIEKENQQLKDLLERASYCIIGYRHNDHLPERVFYEEEVSNLLEEIDNAIGEKK